MKRILILTAIFFVFSSLAFSQLTGGNRALRIQATGGFQNGIGADAEYTLPFNNNKLALRVGFSMLPISIGNIPIAGLKSDFDMNTTTFDIGLKYYFGGDGHGFFLGVDFANDSKSVLLSNINGQTDGLQTQGNDGNPQDAGNVKISEGKIDETITSTLITPKIGWTNISSNGFTWSLELGYSIASVDPFIAAFDAKDDVTNKRNTYYYTFNNLYEDLFGLKGLPYVRLGVGYAIKFGR